jgi:hypothetical protein
MDPVDIYMSHKIEQERRGPKKKATKYRTTGHGTACCTYMKLISIGTLPSKFMR